MTGAHIIMNIPVLILIRLAKFCNHWFAAHHDRGIAAAVVSVRKIKESPGFAHELES